MNLNKLIARLRQLQKNGCGKLAVHVLAHDNSAGESQGTVFSVSYYEKDPLEPRGYSGKDDALYSSTPDKMIYLHLG